MSIYIGIPTYDGRIEAQIASGILQLSKAHDIHLGFMSGSLAGIGTSRNIIVKSFLKSPCDWLYFWDADIVIPNPAFMLSLIDCADRMHASIVGGAYVIKDGRGEYAVGMKKGMVISNFKKGELTKPTLVDVLGTGAMLIHRSVFEKIPDPWFEVRDLPNGQFMPEDYTFCLKAKEKGISIACDPRFETLHMGTQAFVHKLT